MARTISVQFTGDVSKLLAAFAAAANGGKAFGRTMETRLAGVGKSMVRGVTLPVVAGFALAMNAAGNFEGTLNTFQAVAGATAGQMKKVSGMAKKLGADVKLPGTSASDAAAAMTELAKGGLSVEQSMAAARGTLQLAAAAETDNATAAMIVADSLNAFGLAGGKAGMVADLLAASANASTASIDDMALGLKQSSAVAKQAGVPIDQTVAALARLANAGIKGSDAGTSLKTMLLRLIAPAGAGAKKIKELGLSLRDQQGNLKPLPALAEEFSRKLGKLPKAQRDAALAAIFGSDAIRAGNILLMKGGDAQEAMRKKVSKQGAASELAAAKMKGFKGAMEAFKSTVETLAITFGQMLLPIGTKVLRWAANLAAAIDGLPGPARGAVVGFLAFAAATGPVLFGIGKFVGALPTLKAGIKGVGVAMKFLAANPIILVIAGLAALVAAFIYAYRNSETFRNIVNGVLRAVATAAQAFASFFTQTLPAAFNAVVSWVRSNWPKIAIFLAGPFAPLVALATDAFGIRSKLIAAFQAIFAAAKAAFNKVVGAVKSAMSSAVSAVLGIVGKILAAAVTVGKAVVTGVKNGLAAIASIASTIVQKLAAVIDTAATWVLQGARKIGSFLVDGIVAGIKAGAGKLAAVAGWVKEQTIDRIGSLLGISSPSRVAAEEIGKPIAQGIAAGITGNTKFTGDAAKRFAGSTIAALNAQKSTLRTAFERLASLAMQAFDDQTDAEQEKRGKAFAKKFGVIDAFQADLTPAEAEIKKIQDGRDAARILQSVADAERDLADAQSEGDSRAIMNAQRALDDARLEQRLAALQEQARVQRAARDKEAEDQRTALQNEIDESDRHFNAMRASQRESLESTLELQRNALLRGKTQQAGAQAEIIALLNGFGIDYKTAGERLGDMFAAGLRSSVDNVSAAAGKVAATVARKLKLHSPAKEGPLASLDSWWRPFTDVLVSGLDMGRLSSVAANLALQAPTPVAAPASARGGGATVNVTVVDRTAAGMSRTQARRIADDIAPELARRVGIAL